MNIQTNINNETADVYFNGLVRKVNERFQSGVPANISAANHRSQWKETYNEIGQILSILGRSADGSISRTESLAVLNSLPDGIYEAKTSGEFPFGIVAKEGYYTRFKKTSINWSLHSEIKSATLDGVIAYNNAAGVTGDVVWRYLHSYGITEFSSTYSTEVGYRLNAIVYSGTSFLVSKIADNKRPLTDSNAWEVMVFGNGGNNPGGNTGTYPTASTTVIGGIKVGWNSEVTVDGQLRVYTLYNYDGTLTGNRTVNLGGYTLTFNNGSVKVNKLAFNGQSENLVPYSLWVNSEGKLMFTNGFGVASGVGSPAIITAAFNPPTLAQLASLNIKVGDYYHCSVNGQRSLFDGQQLISWYCNVATYNALTSDQKLAVKEISIVV